MNKQKGIASMAIMIAILVMAVALPITTKLVQQNQENRSKAAMPIPTPPLPTSCVPNPAESCAFYGLSDNRNNYTSCLVYPATSCGSIKCYVSCLTIGCVQKTCADYGLSTNASCTPNHQPDGCGSALSCYNCSIPTQAPHSPTIPVSLRWKTGSCNTTTGNWTCTSGTTRDYTITDEKVCLYATGCDVTTPTCTSTNWTSTSSSCTSAGQQTRAWTKVGTCTGGVTHPTYPATETVPCTPTTSTCTESNWFVVFATPCTNNKRTITWNNPRTCTGGVTHPTTETVDWGCEPPCTASNWTSTSSSCTSAGQQTRAWTKSGTCTGGVTHPTYPATETVPCTPTTPTSSTCSPATTNCGECKNKEDCSKNQNCSWDSFLDCPGDLNCDWTPPAPGTPSGTCLNKTGANPTPTPVSPSTCARCNNSSLAPFGDATCDGVINEPDFSAWLSEYQKGTKSKADFNCSGSVGIEDFSIWNANFKP